MSELTRTVRTGARLGLRAESILSAALMSELVFPGDSLWVVSSWITDVEIVDNTQGTFDAILGDSPPPVLHLSQMLGLIAAAGAHVHVATRPGTHNGIFLGDSARLSLTIATSTSSWTPPYTRKPSADVSGCSADR